MSLYFNDTSANKNGAIQECETWLFGSNYGSISGNANLLATFTRLINYGQDQTFNVIWEADGSWRHTDPNDTEYSEATTDLSLSNQEYRLSPSHLKIIGVQIMNNQGDYQNMTDINYQTNDYLNSQDPTYYDSTSTSYNYRLKGDILTINPTLTSGSVTLVDGLKVIYQSEPEYFTIADTLTELGVPRTFHDVPVLFACAKYAKSNSMTDKAREIDSELERRKGDITKFFNNRKVASVKRMTPARH